ncbi:MAG: septum formation protein Maf [Clostridia bacterium]|nr:septum formation protein Maf [Clostridia bacterium]
MKIILASKSPRRKEILENLNINFEIITADTNESSCLTCPEKLVEELALRKAEAVKNLLIKKNKFTPDSVIIGCDTVVSKGGKILGKPENRTEAKKMLENLSGSEHKVISGLAVITADKTMLSHEVTKVYFDKLSLEEITAYVATGECDDKAGAYGIQGIAGKFIKGIEGCYFNVVGLPVNLLYRMFKDLKFPF